MTTLRIVEENLTRYGMTTYLLLGNFGNLFNIIIFCQKSHRNNSCSLYLLMVSVVNLFIINFGVIPTVYSLYHVNPETYSIIYCKLRLYLLHSALMISRSLIVLACIDRFIVCSASKYIHSFCRPRIAIFLIIVISLVWPISASHILVLLTIESGRCGAYGTYRLVYSIYSFIVAGFIPPTLMIIFGFLTIRNLHAIHARVRSNIIRISQLHKNDYYLLVMLISEVIVYLISTIPYPIQTLYMTITIDTIRDPSRIEIESFITFMANSFLIYINSAAPFYIYICTSRAYRRQCRKFLLYYWRKMRKLPLDQSSSRRRYSRRQQQQRTTAV